MQWLIDIITEWIEAQGYALQSWVQAQGYLTTGVVDRGPTLDYDFKKVNFTTDNTWRDLSLAAIIPAGTKAVFLEAKIRTGIIGSTIQLRSNDYATDYNIAGLIAQVANVRISNTMIVFPDANRIIEYKISDVVWTDIFLTVRGRWY